MIRLIEINELSLFADMAAAFFAKVNLPGIFNHDVFLDYWKRLIQSNNGFILGRFVEEDPVEAIGAVVYPDMYTGALTSVTAFWYATSSAGLAVGFLEDALRKHWKAIGITHCFVSVLCNERLDKVSGYLVRSGYRLAEMQFRKTLSPTCQ